MMRAADILLLDYGVGNLRSVSNALSLLGYPHSVSESRRDLGKARLVIFPGVGCFGEAMGNLRRLDLLGPLEEEVRAVRKPILGICLGMQLFAESSEEEGQHEGLGWIPGKVVRLDAPLPLRVPHVGWNDLSVRVRDPLFARMGEAPHFYFDHGFHFRCPEEHVLATCRHGGEVVAAVRKDNVFGVQFHPEKSQNNGLRLFKGFVRALLEGKEAAGA